MQTQREFNFELKSILKSSKNDRTLTSPGTMLKSLSQCNTCNSLVMSYFQLFRGKNKLGIEK